MTTFDITVKPPHGGQWAWTWEMSWYEATAPLCMGYRDSGARSYPTREAAKEAAELHARRINETVPEHYSYDPEFER